MRSEAVFPRSEAADERAFYLQGVFRVLLDALARPGELRQLPEAPAEVVDFAARAGLSPWAVEVADVFLDAAISVFVPGEPQGAGDASGACPASHALARRTHAALKPAEEAAFCFLPASLPDREAARALALLSPGTLVSPHLGATCVVECAWLAGRDEVGAVFGAVDRAAAGQAPTWTLSGPGIGAAAPFCCDRGALVRARNDRADEFPCGVDLFFVDARGRVAGLPRSTKAQPVGSAEGGAAWDM